MVESDADRAAFLDPTEFGSAAIYTKSGGSPVALNAIFDSDYFAVELGAQVPVEGSRLRLLCRDHDLPAGAAHGDAVAVAGRSCVVREIHPDGTGMTSIILEEQ